MTRSDRIRTEFLSPLTRHPGEGNKNFVSTFAVTLTFLTSFGCNPKFEPRVYDAPKVETVVVKPASPSGSTGSLARKTPPMMSGSAIPLAERRILGAILPLGNEAIYLKSTDTIERLRQVDSAFRSVAESFEIDVQNRSATKLPDGWELKWRDGDIAAAEINVDIKSGKPVQFTITSLTMPSDPAAWPKYLQDNVNRWRGQLSLAALDSAAIESSLLKIERESTASPRGKLVYIFDENGSGSDATASPKAANGPKSVDGIPSGVKASIPAASEQKVAQKLAFAKPDHWEQLPEKMFRLASFRIGDATGSPRITREVTVVSAKDSPQANAEMWVQQVVKTEDASEINRIAAKALEESELIQAGSVHGKMITIRADESEQSPSITVAVIPTGKEDESLFVKMIADWQTAQTEKPNLVSFVKSLRWE